MIDVINLKKTFNDGFEVIKGIDLTIEKGDIMCIIGPSGSGKSTFLRCLNCMEDATDGQIIYHDVDIADPSVDINVHRQHMGMVFQHFNLFNNKTVIQNIMMAPVHIQTKAAKKKGSQDKRSREQIKKDAYDNAMRLLGRIGLERI